MARGPGRPPLRQATPRDEDSRARAAARAEAIREHVGGDLDEGEDKFFVPPQYQPDGFEYEWKRNTILGAQDPSYQTSLARKGWEAVPASRHPDMMPGGYRGHIIERDGMVLMERPKEINDEVRKIERQRATHQVREKERQLSGAPPGSFDRVDAAGNSTVKVSKSFAPLPSSVTAGGMDVPAE